MFISETKLGDHALAAAFRLIDRAFTAKLAARLRKETLHLLRSDCPLPEHFTNEVIASGDDELLKALASSWRHQNIAQRLAEFADPALAVPLYCLAHSSGDYSVRTAVLAGAAKRPNHPGWYTKEGLVPNLLAHYDLDVLTPALLGPFPQVIRHALMMLSEAEPAADNLTVIHACAELVRYGEAAELGPLAELPGWSQELREILGRVAAAPNPAAELDKAKEEDPPRPNAYMESALFILTVSWTP